MFMLRFSTPIWVRRCLAVIPVSLMNLETGAIAPKNEVPAPLKHPFTSEHLPTVYSRVHHPTHVLATALRGHKKFACFFNTLWVV